MMFRNNIYIFRNERYTIVFFCEDLLRLVQVFLFSSREGIRRTHFSAPLEVSLLFDKEILFLRSFTSYLLVSGCSSSDRACFLCHINPVMTTRNQSADENRGQVTGWERDRRGVRRGDCNLP